MPVADLEAPGWEIHQGQAVWQRSRATPEVAGEIMIAIRGGDQTFVQFSKNGFPLLAAQTRGNRWQAEVPTENKRFSGCGPPPRRLLALYLPRALTGSALPAGWKFTNGGDGTWRLENQRSGESLEGYFNP